MRYIIVLIALLALCSLTSTMWAQQASSLSTPVGLSKNLAPLEDPAETALTTTPSIAAFLSNSWIPPSALNASANTSLNNTTSRLDTTAVPPIYTASAANKDGVVAWTGESRFQFLKDDWTPSTPVEEIPTTPFKRHQMN